LLPPFPLLPGAAKAAPNSAAENSIATIPTVIFFHIFIALSLYDGLF
jgi:hypothetical protein